MKGSVRFDYLADGFVLGDLGSDAGGVGGGEFG